MSEKKQRFGFTDDELKTQPKVFADKQFDGKTVVVSGAGSGIGKAIATLFARLGADLVICGRTEEKLQTAKTYFESIGASVDYHVLNIREPENVEAFMDKVWEKHGKLDVLVNNAGGQFPMPAIEFPIKGWDAVIDNNLNGTWYMMQSAAKRWRDHQQEGNIVNIVAVIDRGLFGAAHTCAARAAVVYLSKSMSVEWAPYKIRVNCIAPGCIESNGFNHYPEEGIKSFYQSNPMKKTGDVQDVAQAVVYFASEASSFINGELINIDGGGALWGDVWTTGKPDYFNE